MIEDASLPPLQDSLFSFPGLIRLIDEYGLPKGITRSLDAKLEAAQDLPVRLNEKDLGGPLRAFIQEVKAQAGKFLTEEEARVLTALAKTLR